MWTVDSGRRTADGGRRKIINKEKNIFVHFQKQCFYPFAKPVDQWHVFGSKSVTHSGAIKLLDGFSNYGSSRFIVVV